ncbi:MAG: SDR family oxidoreductase [Clostridia bacterium]|nr:SDR family oxidoreductase [Clostridia bacterium]
MKKKKLENQIAVITGGNSGIGLAIARRLHNEGARVVNISLHAKENEIFEKSLKCDISNNEQARKTVEQIVEAYGKIDMLFCNAGMGIAGKIENASLESIDKIMNLNLNAHIKMTNLFLPHINAGGKIFYTSSLAGFLPLPYQACYTASKSGIMSFARALRTEIKDKNIKVCVFMPTDTKTGFTDARIKETSSDAKEAQGIVKMEREERNGKDPDYIAKKVIKFAKKKKPPYCVTAGGFGPLPGWLLQFLVKILPSRFVDWLIAKIYI